MEEPELIPEKNPFREYYKVLDGYRASSRIQVGNLRSVFGFTGTLDEQALKVKPNPRVFNSQGIVMGSRSRHAEPVAAKKKTIIEQHNEIVTQINPVVKHLEGTTKRCCFCYQHYKASENYGFWRCSYHPNPGINIHTYDCCGRNKNLTSDRGCTPCDHQSSPLTPYEPWCDLDSTVDIPLTAAAILKIPRKAYTPIISTTEMARSKAVVSRVSKPPE